jgi:ribonuclease-3
MNSNLESLEQALGYQFRDRALLLRAVTHSSRANEAAQGDSADNERLEFLGDSILGWIVSEWLFSRFRAFTEGQLSLVKNYVVSATHLLAAARRLDLGQYLHLGRGEETAGGRSKQRLLVNAFEAVLAAVYLDGGAEAARDLVFRFVIPPEAEVETLAGAGPPHDYRAELERLARERNLPKPVYTLVSETGPGQARVFVVEARVGKDIAIAAEESSKKKAAHTAARQLCALIRGSG